jgi:hypothetical protein
MYELIPVIENWLLGNGYRVDTIANRIDAQKVSIYVTLFLENFPTGCNLKVSSNDGFFFENLKKYLSRKHLLSYRISCPYCRRITERSNQQCPFCGGDLVAIST